MTHKILNNVLDVNCQIKKKEEFNLSDSECNIYQLFEKEHDNLFCNQKKSCTSETGGRGKDMNFC